MIQHWADTPYLKPLPARGLFFHRRSVQGFKVLSKGCFAYGVTYFPTEDDKPGQPACHMVFELDMERNIYVTECHQESAASHSQTLDRLMMIHDGIERSAVQAVAFPIKANIYGVRTWFLDRQQFNAIDPIFSELLQTYRRANRRIPRHVNLTPLGSDLDFHAAVSIVQSEILAGRLKVDLKAGWLQDFMAELCQWPTVRTDARVRALAIGVSALPEMMQPTKAEVAGKVSGSQWTA